MNNPLKEDYVIRIKSRVEPPVGSIQSTGEPEYVELVTRGGYVSRGGSYYITYKETEATGFAGCVTTIKIAFDASRIAILRFGQEQNEPTQLLIEKGRRNLCHYETGFGSITIGITADEISSSLDQKGGKVSFSYLMDGDSAELVSRNSLEITVTHIN